jgi:aarF domain-containing kinase
LDTDAWLEKACRALEKSGPVFIKFGQWASTRPDVFSQEICSVLSTLQSNVRAHSKKFTLKELRQSFTAEQLQYISVGELIGSGSMAQVHAGSLNLPGKDPLPIAIKVLHPHTEQRVGVDLLLLRIGAKLISLYPGNRWLSLTESVEQFRLLLDQHADLKAEAKNMLQFQHNFTLWSDIKFATPIYPYVSPTVLVQSREYGVPLTDFMLSVPEQRVLAAQAKVHTKRVAKPLRQTDRRLALLGLDMFLKMMVTDNFVHADLHPGNMIVNVKDEKRNELAEARIQENLERKRRGETPLPVPELTLEYLLSIDPNHLSITVLDTALVTSLTPRNRVNFLSLFGAIVQGEGRVAARLMKNNAREQLVVDEEAYENEMNTLVSQVPNLNMKTTDVGQLLQRCMNIVRNHRVKIESDFASLVMSLIIVEGVGRRLDPKLNVIEESINVFAHNPDAVKILWDQCGLKMINPLTVQALISQLQSHLYNFLHLQRD